MAISKKQFREKLVAFGVWGRFVEWREWYRKLLIEKRGFETADAAAKAWADGIKNEDALLDGRLRKGVSISPDGECVTLSPEETKRIDVEGASIEAERRRAAKAGSIPKMSASEMEEYLALPQDADYVTEIQWVKGNLFAPVRPRDAPSRGAWGWLVHCRSSEKTRSEFFNTQIPKLAPSKTQVEGDPRFRDDARRLDDLDAKLLRIAQEANA